VGWFHVSMITRNSSTLPQCGKGGAVKSGWAFTDCVLVTLNVHHDDDDFNESTSKFVFFLILGNKIKLDRMSFVFEVYRYSKISRKILKFFGKIQKLVIGNR